MNEKPVADAELQARVRARVDAVVDDPEARLRIRESYYERYGFGAGGGFGSSELKFLEWEVKRGVLNPLAGPRPGSPWWRAVNEGLIVQAEEAAELFAAGHAGPPTGPVKQWLAYLREPSARSWYRAHNASIVSGYLTHAELARREDKTEQIFVNIVLYRVLYAQAMVEGLAPGIMSRLASAVPLLKRLQRAVADPRSPSVDLIVKLPEFYPDVYPATRVEIATALGLSRWGNAPAQAMFNQKLISPALGGLYRVAATWLDIPDLQRLVSGNTPIYPRSLGDTHAT